MKQGRSSQARSNTQESWARLHGVHHPRHTTPSKVQPFPKRRQQLLASWSDRRIRKRPAFFPSGDIGYNEIEKHFPQDMLPPHSGMALIAWWDRLIACYNTIGRIDKKEYLSDFDLRLFLQAIQEDGQCLFWTPSYAMLDHDTTKPAPQKDQDMLANVPLMVHLIRFETGGGHFAALIYDSKSRRWIFADSLSSGREVRFNIACRRLQQWLVESKLAPYNIQETDVQKRGTVVHITEQQSPWTCGLVAIDFVRAFMREGLNDWAESYGADPESQMIQSWSAWMHYELGHAPDIDVRIPRVPELSRDKFVRTKWPATKTPPPRDIKEGRSQNTPIEISPSLSPPVIKLQNPPNKLPTPTRQSKSSKKKCRDTSISTLNQRHRIQFPEAIDVIDLSEELPNATKPSSNFSKHSSNTSMPEVNQQKSQVGLKYTPYRHSVTPERNIQINQEDRLSPSHPTDWRGWDIGEGGAFGIGD